MNGEPERERKRVKKQFIGYVGMQANARLGFDVIRGESWVVVFFTFSNFDWILSRWNISSSRPRLDFYQELIQFSDWARRSKGVEKHECFVEDCTINMDLLNLEYRFLRKVFLERENIWFDSIWNLECRFVLSRRWIKTEWSSRIETDIKITKTCATFRLKFGIQLTDRLFGGIMCVH